MSFDRCSRFKDPFSTSSLPKSFYCPTPAKDVDINTVIQGPERKDQLPKRPDLESAFTTSSTFRLAALPQLKSVVPKNATSAGHLTNSRGDYDETCYEYEQPSNSTLLDTTQLTSSIDEKEALTMGSLSHQGQHSSPQDASISVIQNYINRFRYSAPKPREERDRENTGKKNTFWWLNSGAPSPEVMKQSGKGMIRPSSGVHDNPSKQNNEVKLTREAILELDKETLDLQQKADKLLSKSHLSLASSGPCVSTDGIGSSSALSECSYRTDPQPAYRPIFVNLQGEYPPVPSKERYQRIDENEPLNPGDVLSRWRMRRKIEDAQQTKTYMPVKQRAVRNHSEIDIRLDEFRKKLFAQRALITSEDIRFERQRMKMIIDDDESNESQHEKIEVKQDKKDLHSSTPQNEDLVLARLRKITGTTGLSSSVKTAIGLEENLSNGAKCGTSQDIHSSEYNSHIEGSKSFNLNRTSDTQPDDNRIILSSCSNEVALNTNNTALERRDDPESVRNYSIDEMKSMSVCDATQKTFVLGGNSKSTTSAHVKKVNVDSLNTVKDFSKSGGQQEEAVMKSHSSAKDSIHGGVSHCAKNAPYIHDSVCSSEQNAPYHQRLQAEKPCDEFHSASRVRRESDIDNGNSSLRNRNKEYQLLKSSKYESFETSDENEMNNKKGPQQKRQRSKHKTDGSKKYLNNREMDDVSSENSDILCQNEETKSLRSDYNQSKKTKSPRIGYSHNDRTNSPRSDHNQNKSLRDLVIDGSQTKLKMNTAENRNRPTAEVTDSGTKFRKEPLKMERISSSVSRSPQQGNIRKVIGETVVDHLFDGPSMISSVDSWASLFPQSPGQSHSFYNSTVVTPTKDMPSNDQITSTPHHDDVSVTQEPDNSNYESDEEFADDPLMNLLLMQKKEYIRKLELIESKLQALEEIEN